MSISKADPIRGKVLRTIEKHSLLSPGDRVVVAVSGGPDSVCLLSVLRELSKDFGLTLHVAHLDHMFRGKESADEALFVADLAKKLDLPATLEKIDVPAICRERGLSSQAGAREARYDFLQRVADDVGASRIATGHTADDQAETFLMRLVRGAGISGLSAIPPLRGNIIRPLIECTRHEVLEHLQSAGLAFKTDSSNAKPVYTRNRIRLEVLPVLKSFNPRIVETLAMEAALLRDEDEAVEAYLSGIVESACLRKDDLLSVKRGAFDAHPPAFRRRLLRQITGLAGLEPSALTRAQVNEALSFMAVVQTGRTMSLPQGLTITREYDRFIFAAKPLTAGFSQVLTVPGNTAIPGLGVTVETAISDGREPEGEEKDSNYIWQARFDYDKIGPLLTMRTRRPGDRFQPAGMGGRSKKIQDYFVDEKIPRRKRDSQPLLAAEDEILWVVGLRTDERFLPGEDASRVLVVTVKRER
jgi:tRNA(Ile)-lysidine synthase